jgi:hypothetical protein
VVKPTCGKEEACENPQKMEKGDITIVHIHENGHGYAQKPAK